MRKRTTKSGIYARKFDMYPEMAKKIKLFGQEIGKVMFGTPSVNVPIAINILYH